MLCVAVSVAADICRGAVRSESCNEAWSTAPRLGRRPTTGSPTTPPPGERDDAPPAGPPWWSRRPGMRFAIVVAKGVSWSLQSCGPLFVEDWCKPGWSRFPNRSGLPVAFGCANWRNARLARQHDQQPLGLSANSCATCPHFCCHLAAQPTPRDDPAAGLNRVPPLNPLFVNRLYPPCAEIPTRPSRPSPPNGTCQGL